MAIEYILLDYLITNMTVPCYMEEPDNPDEEYVLIEKTGSSVENFIHHATFAIQSYGSTMEQAVDLNEVVKGVMDEFWKHHSVYSCKLNSDYNFTDTDTHRYRYQAVYEMTY